MSRIIHIRIGQIIVAFLCENQEINDILTLYYKEYIPNSSANVIIIISVKPSVKTIFLKPGTQYTYVIDKDTFNFGPDLIQGRWDKTGRTCHLFISKAILTPEEIWLFNRFLCSFFYTIFRQDETQEKKAVIIHGAGILKNNKGYLFFGPPESGKSTIASFSQRYEVLHDDMSIVTIEGNKFSLEGLPFNPRQLSFSHGTGPLSMILSLQQYDKVKIEKGTPQEFVKRVLPEVFLPLPILSEDKKSAYQYSLHCIKKMAETIPYYCLYFKKDESFWDLINKMEEDYGGHTEVLYQEK